MIVAPTSPHVEQFKMQKMLENYVESTGVLKW